MLPVYDKNIERIVFDFLGIAKVKYSAHVVLTIEGKKSRALKYLCNYNYKKYMFYVCTPCEYSKLDPTKDDLSGRYFTSADGTLLFSNMDTLQFQENKNLFSLFQSMITSKYY